MRKWTPSGLSAMLILAEQHGISVAEVLTQERGPSSYTVSVSPQQGRPPKSCTESGLAVIQHKERNSGTALQTCSQRWCQGCVSRA